MTERGEKIAKILVEIFEDQQQTRYVCTIKESGEEKAEKKNAAERNAQPMRGRYEESGGESAAPGRKCDK